jgi:hypothetical protein
MQLTPAEFNQGYGLAVAAFRTSQKEGWAEWVYKVNRKYDVAKAKLLFLYCYALSTWDTDETAVNYLTQEQMAAIINKASET